MITLECNYSKKIGLPAYSSHQFSITLRTEISDLSKVEEESGRLYQLLQESVDNSMQEVGFLPDSTPQNGHRNGNGHGNGSVTLDVWKCSDAQKGLILKIVSEHRLDKLQIEALAKDRFNTPIKMLNKLQASSLIQELLQQYPTKNGVVRGGR